MPADIISTIFAIKSYGTRLVVLSASKSMNTESSNTARSRSAAGSLFYLGYLALKSSPHLPLNLHHLNSRLNSIFTVRFLLTAEHLFPFVLEIHYQNQTCTYTLAHSQYNHLHGGLHWLIKSASESISIDKAHLGCRFKTDNKGQESFNNCHLTC